MMQSGKKFGLLTTLNISTKQGYDGTYSWLCICSCGNYTTVAPASLRSGNTKSCGCLAKLTRFQIKHGKNRSRTARSWEAMLSRCFRKKDKSYHRYGGRGITVCDEWRSFEKFYRDMGERPEGKTLDRINNDGNYELKNCKWSTPKEQSANRSNSSPRLEQK